MVEKKGKFSGKASKPDTKPPEKAKAPAVKEKASKPDAKPKKKPKTSGAGEKITDVKLREGARGHYGDVCRDMLESLDKKKLKELTPAVKYQYMDEAARVETNLGIKNLLAVKHNAFVFYRTLPGVVFQVW